MAKKEFMYRGKNLQELQKLSVAEFAELLPSAQRRKIKRGFTEAEQAVVRKLSKKSAAKTHARDMIILPGMVGKTIKVHNGKEFAETLVTDEMIGHIFGEFSQTRKSVKHGSAGIGSTSAKNNKT